MARVSFLDSPLLLGFDEIERALEQVSRSASDGYPPYNIEKLSSSALRITLAVAGFTPSTLSVTVEDSQLVIRGKQPQETEKEYLHRGIAARQFQRSFVLADGIEVAGAELSNGLLHIDLKRLQPETVIRKIEIVSTNAKSKPTLTNKVNQP